MVQLVGILWAEEAFACFKYPIVGKSTAQQAIKCRTLPTKAPLLGCIRFLRRFVFI